eukprot:Nitzschia sp. Nitz4//scaffold116_size91068//2150//4366//NITZ4_004944-RA/size91068-processed-gene-0.19-mRNA-1//1//CDS//3329533536//5442//frame0
MILMKNFFGVLAAVALLSTRTAVTAATNDECSQASTLSSIPTEVNVDTSSAAIMTSASNACIDVGSKGVWYKYSPSQDIIVALTMINKEYPSRIVVFEGSCSALICLDYTNGFRYVTEVLDMSFYAGTTYYILITGQYDDDAGTATLSITSPGNVANDDCSSATNIPSIPASIYVDNSAAVPSFSDSTCNVESDWRGVWYQYTSTFDIIVELKLTNQDFSAKFAVFEGSCGSLTCIDHVLAFQYVDREIQFPTYTGVTYYILVVGGDDDEFGTATLSITSAGNVANDDCSSATNIPSIPASIYVDNSAAVPSSFADSTCNVESDWRGVWYQYTSTFDTIVELKLTNQDFSAKFAVFEGSCGSLTCIDDVFALQYSDREIQFPTYTGVTYYILVVGGDDDEFGAAQITLTSVGNVANDECAGAVTVSSLPYEAVIDTTPAVPYIDTTICGSIHDTDRVLWYKYSPTEDHRMQLSVSDSPDNSFYPEFAIFSGTSCNDITACMIYGSHTSAYYPGTSVSDDVYDSVQMVVHAGVTYYILIFGKYLEGEFGSTTLSIEKMDDLENDVCTSATNVQSLPFQTRFSTADKVPGYTFYDDNCQIHDYTRGVWYQYTPSVDSVVSVKVYDQNFLYVETAVFQGSCDALTCLQVDGAYFDFFAMNLEFDASAGVTYSIFVVGEGAYDVGEATISIESTEVVSPTMSPVSSPVASPTPTPQSSTRTQSEVAVMTLMMIFALVSDLIV